jgi:hypothetical protein
MSSSSGFTLHVCIIPFSSTQSRRTCRFTILEWVIDLPRESWHKNTENPTFTRRQQNKLSSLVGQEEVLTSLVMNGFASEYITMSSQTHHIQQLPPREDKQPVVRVMGGWGRR